MLLSHRYPPGEELTWVGGVIRSWDAALVEVTLSDGSAASARPARGSWRRLPFRVSWRHSARTSKGVRFSSPLEVGDHLRAYTAFWARGGIASGVAGAIETAALDAVAVRQRACPPTSFWAARGGASIEAYASGGLGTTFEEVSAWASQQVATASGP